MRLDSAGNMGLGVTPSAWSQLRGFQLVGGSSVASQTNALYLLNNAFYDGSAWRYINTSQATRLDLSGGAATFYNAASGTAGNAISFTQAMTLDASGNLGIANTSPSQKVSIGFTTGTVGYNIVYTGGGGGEVASFTANGSTGEVRIGGTASTYFPTFYSNGSERARIDSSGRLLVNTTTNTTGADCFAEIYGGSDVKSGLNIRASGSSGTRYLESFFVGTNTNVGAITTNGTTTTYSTLSDYRLKENIAPMTGALATVAQLKPCTYTWKTDGSTSQGFIAHELQAVVPDAVAGEKDAVNEDGSIKPQGIDTSFLVATLTAAIQEQQAMIASQSAIITQLQADVAALKGNA